MAGAQVESFSIVDRIVEGLFEDVLLALKEGNKAGAVGKIAEIRKILDEMDDDSRDETIDWFSARIQKLPNQSEFDRALEFLVENNLAEE